MEEKTKATISRPETSDKGNHFSIIYQVLEIFKTGQEATAKVLNEEIYFNDARKAISILRKQGYPIKDRRHTDGRKIYFLPSDWERIMREPEQSDKQLTLF